MIRPLVFVWGLSACAPAADLKSPPLPDNPNLEAVASQLREELESRGIDHLKWAITPFRGNEEGSNPYTLLTQSVSERLGIPIELNVGEDYEDLEKQIITGESDLGVLGPYSYVRTRKKAEGIHVFASHISRGNITYGAYIISRSDGPIRTLSDLPGQRMAFVDERSASGWLFPAARLLEEGIHPTHDIKHRYYGNHESVVKAVLEGEAEAGATYSDVLRDRQRDGLQEFHIVAKGALVPHDAYVLRAGLPPIVGQAIGLAMAEVSTRDEEGRRILGPLRPINGFISVSDDHYQPVRLVEAQVSAALGSQQ